MKRKIAEIVKNTRERIIVELDEYEGRDLISARTWYFAGDMLKPTPKGLSIEVRHLPSLAKTLVEAERIAREAGLL